MACDTKAAKRQAQRGYENAAMKKSPIKTNGLSRGRFRGPDVARDPAQRSTRRWVETAALRIKALLPLAPSPIPSLSCLGLLTLTLITLITLIKFVNEVDPTFWQRFVQNDIKALLQR